MHSTFDHSTCLPACLRPLSGRTLEGPYVQFKKEMWHRMAEPGDRGIFPAARYPAALWKPRACLTQMQLPVIALLGRKDEPTDAVEEYCRYLSTALQAQNVQLEIYRVRWEIVGWRDALRGLKLQAKLWRGTWVLIQYTALAWSSRGFPQKVIRTVKTLKSAGARIAILYHDVEPYPGTRLVDRVRRAIQLHTMRQSLFLSDLAIFTVSLDKISWLSSSVSHAHFIPVGPNLPIPERSSIVSPTQELPTIGVFSITGGAAGNSETQTILSSVCHAAERLGKLRLLVFGRHAEVREARLREGFRGLPVELSVEGILEPAEVVQKLSACDLLLFIRGPISSRRGSAIAGIACGLPVIAYAGSETAVPITDAGVVLVSPDQPNELNAALVRVLSDTNYRIDLAARSRAAYKTHFAWPSIAGRFCALLKTH
jgi:glycosyltransferase involved in cell wall biosynthesis